MLLVALLVALALAQPMVARAADIRQITLPTSDLIYDPATQRIWASVPSRAGSTGNSVAPIDPLSGHVGSPVFIGSEPGRLAISDDHQMLYVALDGAAAVRRFRLATQTPEMQFTLGSDQFFGPRFADDIEVQPGHADTVAVSMRYQRVSPSFAGVAIFDNGIQRSRTVPQFSSTGNQVNSIEWSASPSRLYGGSREASPTTFYRLDVDASGVAIVDGTSNLYSGFGTDIEFDDGRIYAGSGQVIDPETRSIIGTFSGIASFSVLVRPDAARGRVFFLLPGGRLLAFDARTFVPLGFVDVPGIYGTPSSLIRWGTDGLAFRTTGDQVFLIRSPLISGDVGDLVAAVLPASRSVQVGAPATAFSTVVNPSDNNAVGCSLAPLTQLPVTFHYQTTDPTTNELTGTLDTPVDIPAHGSQSFLFAVTPDASFDATDMSLSFDCANSSPAPVIVGLNTLLLSSSETPVPDVVALAATLSHDGIVNVPGATETGLFVVATVNVGAGGTITASVDTGAAHAPLALAICQTDLSSRCTSPPAVSITTTIAGGATPTFAVFVTGTGVVPFDPAHTRVFVRFKDADRVTRGATSVAVRTEPPSVGGTYAGSGSISQTNCTNPANNGTVPVQAFATIADQGIGSFVGTVTVTYSGVPAQATRVDVTGSVDATGQASGTMQFSTAISGIVVVSGDGGFTGQVSGDSLALTFTGQARSGETCHVSGSLALAR